MFSLGESANSAAASVAALQAAAAAVAAAHRQQSAHQTMTIAAPTSAPNAAVTNLLCSGNVAAGFGSPPPPTSSALPPASMADLASTASSLLYALHQSTQSNAAMAVNTILVSTACAKQYQNSQITYIFLIQEIFTNYWFGN